MKQNNILLVLTGIIIASPLSAQTFSNLNFDFSEYAFSTGTISGSTGFNLINDTTGAELISDNGDLDDLTITITTSIPSNAAGAHADAEITSGGLVSNHGWGNTFANTYSAATPNNPGTLIKQTIRMSFANHLSIQDFETDFRSLNTRGITWEHTELAYLKKDGSYFTAAPAVGDYLSWQAAAAAEQGSPSQGWWLAASTGTVTNVGTVTTVAGSNGSLENMTNTGGTNDTMTYSDVGLAAGTEVGGFEWTVYLYDNRGQDNNQTNWTVTQNFFEITGEVVPEPSSAMLLGLGSMTLLLRRKK
ncbi:MAG: PEP-CTERM sorting domain-containing protein [Akkermansiaceae bacterium]